ncbi:MAG: PDZ domain-containing protein [Planctomycetes bacterium]|nr:PDZ domain-containing protein [Planctomycetota bacterium]
MKPLCLVAFAFLLALSAALLSTAGDPAAKAKAAKDTAELSPAWIYDDLPAAVEQAKKENKPLLAVFRCPPCKELKSFDEKVAKLDGELAEISKSFVCVRLIQMRGLDTAVFQYDFDQTWSAMFLNADMTVYGRYGSQAGGGDKTEILYSVAGLKAAMERAAAIHKAYPGNKETLKPKQGKAYPWKTAESMPSLQERYKDDNFPKNCIHCHMAWKGVRRSMLMQKTPLPDSLIYVYPFPDSFGMRMDAVDGVKVTEAVKDSLAAKAGLAAGDVVETIGGAPIVSLADIQFALQNCADNESLKISVARGAEKKTFTVALCGDWRKSTEISWRESAGDLRPGFPSGPLTAEERTAAGVKEGGLKILRMHERSSGRKLGFVEGDILVKVGGEPVPATEKEFLALLRQKFLLGQKVKFELVRDGKKTELSIDIP